MISFVLIVVVTVLQCLLFVRSRKHLYQTWERLQVNGPKPEMLAGNNREFYKHPLKFVSETVKKYGKISGFYIGPIPVVIVKDLEIISHVLIKKFDNFVNRTNYPLLQVNPLQDSVLSLREERWRSVRSVLSPFFTAAKLKKTVNIVKSSADVMADKVESYEKEGFNVYEPSQRCVIDVLFQVVLGRKENIQKNMDHRVFKSLQNFSGDMRSGVLKIGYLFPSVMSITNRMTRYFSSGKQLKTIQTHFERFIEMKRNTDWKKSFDFLSLMLKHNHEADGSKKLTENELLAATLSFVLVGFDTTASSIAYCLYMLSHHACNQEDLYNEIQDVIGEDGNLTYDDIMHKMPILDQIYKETLRMYPPFPVFATRECKTTCELKGLKIPAGSSVMIPIKELHYDKELWDEPELFIPSRFAPENAHKIPPLAYQPFLDGSRNCIGKNLGILISKIIITKIVMKYHILPTTETRQEIPSGIVSSAVNYPKSGTNIKLKTRIEQ